jgi:carbamoyl-phosphate synthase small subunit
MADLQAKPAPGWAPLLPTALLVLSDGTVCEGFGCGATGSAVGEVCFNTAMTGYQEILTDPSYAGQIVTFTFPHIGNVGTNFEDQEDANPKANPGVRGLITHAKITNPSNYRARQHLDDWLKTRNIIGLYGLDTRALTGLIRDKGMPNAVIAHDPEGHFDLPALKAQAQAWPGIDGMDLVPEVTTAQGFHWTESVWSQTEGYIRPRAAKYHVVTFDCGVKSNILRLLTEAGCRLTVLPANTPADEIKNLHPDGIFISNGPGDPAETGKYAVPVIKSLLDAKIPTFGICLGHQLMALAVGAKTMKMHQGHHGANHPVKDLTTGKVEIVSMNHGFAVDPASLPSNARETHRSLFDGSNSGFELTDRPAFAVQHHPEASPGPRDSHYLFRRFAALMEEARSAPRELLRNPEKGE